MDTQGPRNHHHGHAHDHRDTPVGPLTWALGITGLIFVAQLVGALVSGSLALLSDSMHMLADSTALVLALLAALVGRRAATARATYGHRRVEVLAALVNALTVTAVTAWIAYTAVARVVSGASPEIDATVMLAVAVVGLAANAVSAVILWRHQQSSVNVRAAFLHVMTDLLGSVFVIVAAVVISVTGFVYADTVASLVIVAMIAPRAAGIIRDVLHILLDRVPAHIDSVRIREELEQVPGVRDIHDLHIWTIDGENVLATCHAVVDPLRAEDGCGALDRLRSVFVRHGISHPTIQVEHPHHHRHEYICH